MINSETQVLGLIGHPVFHSKSPQMHNALLDHLELNMRYLAFDVEHKELKQAIEGIKALNFKGVNVTIPHKVDVIPYLDEVSHEANAIGAVNTIVNKDGKLVGYNTDGEGYVRSLIEETGVTPKGKKVLLLGAGGASRAIAYTFSRYEVDEIILANRNQDKADQIKQLVQSHVNVRITDYTQLELEAKSADIIVNTTSIGMYPNIEQTLIPKEYIQSNHIVSDIVYNPLETQLLKDAKEKGAIIHAGIGMFLYQGAIAFEKWTGMKANTDIMKDAVIKTLR